MRSTEPEIGRLERHWSAILRKREGERKRSMGGNGGVCEDRECGGWGSNVEVGRRMAGPRHQIKIL